MMRIGTNKGAAYISVLILMIVVFTLGLALLTLGMNSVRLSQSQSDYNKALNAAEAGVSHACWSFGTNYNNCLTTLQSGGRFPLTGTVAGTLTTGSYTYYMLNSVPQTGYVKIESVGTCNNQTVKLWVVAQINQSSTRSAIFDYALFSDKTASMSGNSNISGNVRIGHGDLVMSGNVNIGPAYDPATGDKIKNGDVYASGRITSSGNISIAGSRNQNSPPVSIPSINLSYYRDKTTYPTSYPYTEAGKGIYYSGSVSFSGNKQIPVSNNGIIYVDGDLNISGNVTGRGTIVCTGNANISGNVSFDSGSGMIAIVTIGSINLSGNGQIYGVLMANNVNDTSTYNVSGNARVVGAVVADMINASGNMSIAYDPRLNTALDLPGDTITNSIQRKSWQQVYN